MFSIRKLKTISKAQNMFKKEKNSCKAVKEIWKK